jgi:hypothetical protein
LFYLHFIYRQVFGIDKAFSKLFSKFIQPFLSVFAIGFLVAAKAAGMLLPQLK